VGEFEAPAVEEAVLSESDLYLALPRALSRCGARVASDSVFT
jgi:hypothetical protein